jgi:hypothetical protein
LSEASAALGISAYGVSAGSSTMAKPPCSVMDRKPAAPS